MLIDFYLQVDKDLAYPELRGDMEKSLDEIAQRRRTYESVVDTMLNTFQGKFINFKAQIEKLSDSLQKDFKTIDQAVLHDGKLFSKCGCGRIMNYSEQAEMLKCEFCGFTLKLQRKPRARICNSYCQKLVAKSDKQTKPCGF